MQSVTTRALKIMLIITVFILSFTRFSISALEDEKLHTSSDHEDAQVSDNNNTPVVTTSATDHLISNNHAVGEDKSLTPIDNAASLASGYIQAGKSKDEIIKTLTDNMGYTQTEAAIAYSKAESKITVEPQADSVSTALTAQTENTQESAEATPQKSAKDRVAEGTGQKPGTKFRHIVSSRKVENNTEEGNSWTILTSSRAVTEKEKNTVTEMLDEGYSIEDIAQGFADNGYSTADIAAIFKKAGVSAEDAYSALSKIEIKKAEAKAEQQKPRAKFRRHKNDPNWKENDLEKRKNEAKQGAVLEVLDTMEKAGYDVKSAVDGAVQDLKDAGMSANQVYNAVISKVADGKPKHKFTGRIWSRSNIKFYTKPHMESYGEGEAALAAAMIKAGYSKEEISAQFENKNRYYGYYSYSFGDREMIMSQAEHNLNNTNQQNNDVSSNSTNTDTQEDILKRQTQATPI